jgi:hypothetical protein
MNTSQFRKLWVLAGVGFLIVSFSLIFHITAVGTRADQFVAMIALVSFILSPWIVVHLKTNWYKVRVLERILIIVFVIIPSALFTILIILGVLIGAP